MVRDETPGEARFLTFSCYRRLPLFGNDRIKDRFAEVLAERVARHGVSVFAWVVMPEHVHLVVLPRDAGDIRRLLTSVKGDFAAEVIARWRSLGAPVLPHIVDRGGAAHFWQPGGGFDRNVWGRELLEKVGYCHRNPCKRGLCASSTDWPWSSARAYDRFDAIIGPPIQFEDLPRDRWHVSLT
jgi:putative transposase